MQTSSKQLSGFANYLVEQNLLEHTTIKELITLPLNNNETLITKLIANNSLDGTDLAHAIADYFSIPFVDLKQLQHAQLSQDLLQPWLIQKYRVLPLAKTNDQLQLALADPTNSTILNTVKFHTTLHINPAVVAYDQLTQVIEKNFPTKKYIPSANEDAPIIKFIDQILNDAITEHASDIHFEPYEECYRIRFRIDGLLYEVAKTESLLGPRFSARLKIMANLDIAEKRLPQDGRFTLKLATNQNQDCRLSVCPTMFGEKLVVRILNPINISLNIKHLGFSEKEQQLFCKHIQMPHGLILVTGPTGSGKTITLYTALNILNQPTKNISTVEDPVEISLCGINQVEVNHKVGLSFTTALRTFLRQDPDIIMIGEIRDLETAEIAIKAAHTGHLVLATLHTNSAAASLTRLLNMGVPAFNLASAISLIIAQRLVRKLCTRCKQPQILPKAILDTNNLEENTVLYTAIGCQQCNHGYHERMAIFEMLPITPTISELIMQQCNLNTIEKQMHMLDLPTLRSAALNKVRAGITSLGEVNRVIMA
ncbi:MAG: ATPase, T2SS/T4P/T4SS family [bacterium]